MADWRVVRDAGGGEPGPPGHLPAADQALLDRRIILLNGQVDDVRAAAVAASLVALEAAADDPIEIRMSADSDSLDAAFALMDAIDSLQVEVNSTVAGTVGGTMVGVLAVCRHRRIGALGHIHLREPRAEFSGVASELHSHAVDMGERVEGFARRIAEVTGRPFEHVEADLRAGLHLDAGGALGYGLVDEIAGRPR